MSQLYDCRPVGWLPDGCGALSGFPPDLPTGLVHIAPRKHTVSLIHTSFLSDPRDPFLIPYFVFRARQSTLATRRRRLAQSSGSTGGSTHARTKESFPGLRAGPVATSELFQDPSDARRINTREIPACIPHAFLGKGLAKHWRCSVLPFRSGQNTTLYQLIVVVDASDYSILISHDLFHNSREAGRQRIPTK